MHNILAFEYILSLPNDDDITHMNLFFISLKEYVGNNGDFFTFLKNIGAPKHDLVEIDLRSKKPARYIDVVVPVSEYWNVTTYGVSYIFIGIPITYYYYYLMKL